jgi:hypothetical protein
MKIKNIALAVIFGILLHSKKYKCQSLKKEAILGKNLTNLVGFWEISL